jgi:hypothetical protein
MIPTKKENLKKLSLVFAAISIIIIILILFYNNGGLDGFWICDKNGSWTKKGNPNYPKPVKSCTVIPLPNNQSGCITSGGIWKKQGPEPFATCNRKAVDRGNLCRDNSECEGMCQVDLTKDELSLGMRGKINVNKKYGQCSVWVVELGCNGIMKRGKTQVICVD